MSFQKPIPQNVLRRFKRTLWWRFLENGIFLSANFSFVIVKSAVDCVFVEKHPKWHLSVNNVCFYCFSLMLLNVFFKLLYSIQKDQHFLRKCVIVSWINGRYVLHLKTRDWELIDITTFLTSTWYKDSVDFAKTKLHGVSAQKRFWLS